jgi:hypothetical protein
MADNLTAICEPIVWRKCGSLDIPQYYGLSWPATGIALAFLPFLLGKNIKGFSVSDYEYNCFHYCLMEEME